MVKIYKENATGKLYALQEELRMGSKVCLKPFDRREDKFVAPSTIKRNYTLQDEKDLIVEVKAFTGMKIGLFEAAWNISDDLIYVFSKKGVLMFNVKDYKQVNSNNLKYANKLGTVLGYPTGI